MSIRIKEGHIKAYALDKDNKKSRPRIIRKYQYLAEKMPVKWFLAIFFALLLWKLFVFDALANEFTEHIVSSIIYAIIFSVPFLFVCIGGMYVVKNTLEKRKCFLECIKNARNSKEVYQGEIIAYKIKVHILSGRYNTPYINKLTYILVVQVNKNGVLQKFDTPELKYNPISVLKSNRCMVYKYKKDFYALDFELRTKKTDETADISMRYVCSESFGLVADSMEDFKRKSRKRR